MTYQLPEDADLWFTIQNREGPRIVNAPIPVALRAWLRKAIQYKKGAPHV